MSHSKPYPEIEANPDFAKLEQGILAGWKASGTFEQSVNQRGGAPEYVFYDGPPFANGLPHYGHLLTGYVKDVYARYHTMKGQRVERRFGWDCHGLPAEMGAEKELGISGRQAIQNFGIGNFNEHCRTSVMKYAGEWEGYVDRQARWVDFKNDYKTMDKNFMESVLWAFKQLYDKGLVYESYRVMPYSWAAETPLSNFETKLDNSYRNRTDKAVTVKFKLKEKPKGAPDAENYYVLAWTTTPWTLPSNLALAVSGKLEYACFLHSPHEGESNRVSDSVGGKQAARGYEGANLEHAKAMRKNPTDAEKKLWEILSREQLGVKFRRQQPIGHYIADFYCAEKKLLIEADGGQHADNTKDDKRTQWLEVQGLRLLRFWNTDVLQNPEGVFDKIVEAIQTPHAVSSETAAPPQGGSKDCYIMAASAISKYAKELGFSEEPATCNLQPATLVGLAYEPLFPYFADTPNAFRILDGSDFIEEGSGTGVVHMAPGFGEDDQRVCKANGIDVVVPVDEQGKYTDEVYDLGVTGDGLQVTGEEKIPETHNPKPITLSLRGLNVITGTRKSPDEPYTDEQLKKYGLANLRIIAWLKENDKLIKQEDYNHNYPHCWRTDTPLIYRALPSWYVAVTKFRDRAVELNKKINWIPEHIKDGQMGHMLATAPDWSISRNRFWGTPIPIWRTENGKIKVFGSIAELEEFFEQKVEDLHRPYIDELTKTDADGTWTRVPDVFDCWFESGSMPFAQVHYPFENKEWFETHFPADFITEYVGQTRGWFNTLIMLSTALFDKEPFKNCICHGVVIDEESSLKYSKRLKNYKDPMEVFDKYGSDALRWLMLASPVMRGADLGVDPDGKFIHDVVRLYIKPMWNAYYFFTLYANADGVKAKHNTNSTNLMDRYILAKCADAVRGVDAGLAAYDSPSACKAVADFFEVLNNWYIRRNKDRFWNEGGESSDTSAYDTLYTVLTTICRAAAPLLPLTTEAIYGGLTGAGSVHLADFPKTVDFMNDNLLDGSKVGEGSLGLLFLRQSMDSVRSVCNAALAIRSAENIRVRQPLNSITMYSSHENIMVAGFANNQKMSDYYKAVIQDEVNVKNVYFSNDLAEVATENLVVNSRIAGKRVSQHMKQIIPASKKGDWKVLETNEHGIPIKAIVGGVELINSFDTNEDGEVHYEFEIKIAPRNPKGAAPLSSNDALVVLDLTITTELEAEGLARDVIRMIQDARKKADLNVSDRIALSYSAGGKVGQAIATHEAMIAEQVLATTISQGKAEHAAHQFEDDIAGENISIMFSVAQAKAA